MTIAMTVAVHVNDAGKWPVAPSGRAQESIRSKHRGRVVSCRHGVDAGFTVRGGVERAAAMPMHT